MDTTGILNECLENGVSKANISEEQKKEKIFITTKIKKHKNWTKEEDTLLIDVANKFRQKSWTKVSLFFKDKNPAQCRARYKRIRPGIVKGAWTKEEDRLITDLVNQTGKNWALISKMVPTRNGKQIRDRFLNYLDPNINKFKFTEEDDKKIIEYYIQFGSKWSVIAKFFEGRTGDMIKNRFYSCLKRKVHVYEVNTSKRIRKKYYKSKKNILLSNNASRNIPTNGMNQFSNFQNSKPIINQDNITNIENDKKIISPLPPQENLPKFFSPQIENFLNHQESEANKMILENYLQILSKPSYESFSIPEILAKNLENINKINFLNFSKILNLNSQLANEKEINKINIFNGINLQPFFPANVSPNDLLLLLNLNLLNNTKLS